MSKHSWIPVRMSKWDMCPHSHQYPRSELALQSASRTLHVDCAAWLWICTVQIAFQVAKILKVGEALAFRDCGAGTAAFICFCSIHRWLHQDSCQVLVLLTCKTGALLWVIWLLPNHCCTPWFRKGPLQIRLHVAHALVEWEALTSSCRITHASGGYGFLLFRYQWWHLLVDIYYIIYIHTHMIYTLY